MTVTRGKKRRKRRRTPLRVLEAGGLKILKEREPIVDAGRSLYLVPSASSGSYHDVRYSGGLWSCDCAYHTSGHARRKRICAVRTMLLMWEEASREIKDARVEVPEIRRAKCKGTDFRESTVHVARRGTVTACRCDDPRCGRRFIWRPGFNGKRFSDEIIADALVDAAAGHPSPRIAERMKKNGVAARARTIRRWMREYSDLMARFAATLPYRTGKRCSMDERHLKTHPDRSRKTCWLFAVPDNITWLIPGCGVADGKLRYDATALLSRILERLGRVPDVVIADKLNGYKKGFENAVRSRNPSAVLVADVGVNGRHVNNNRRERLNDEFGDCLSRARGFRSRVPGLVALHILYHNFIHEAGPYNSGRGRRGGRGRPRPFQDADTKRGSGGCRRRRLKRRNAPRRHARICPRRNGRAATRRIRLRRGDHARFARRVLRVRAVPLGRASTQMPYRTCLGRIPTTCA